MVFEREGKGRRIGKKKENNELARWDRTDKQTDKQTALPCPALSSP